MDLMLTTAMAAEDMPTRRRPRCAYRSVDTATGAFVAYVPLHEVRYSRILNGVGGFTAKLKLPPLGSGRWESSSEGDPYEDEYVDEYGGTDTEVIVPTGRALADAYVAATAPVKTTIYVERDGVVVDAFVIWDRSYDHEAQTITVQGAQMWSLVRKRRIRWNATYTATDQLAIVEALIDKAQTSTGGDLGITVSAGTSGRLRDRTYVAHEDKPLGEAIEQLAAVIDGFDFRLDVDRSGDTYARTLRLFYPRVGRDASRTGHVWTLGANMVRLDWPEDGQRAANSIAALGAGEGSSMLRAVVADTTVIGEGYPLLEDSISLKDVTDASTLEGHARAELADRSRPLVLPSATVLADSAPSLGAYVPGDDARLVVPPNRDPCWPDGLDAFARIVEVRCAPPEDGRPETVELVFEEVAG